MASSPDYDAHFEPFDIALISPIKKAEQPFRQSQPLAKAERATPIKRRNTDKENATPCKRRMIKVETFTKEKNLLENLLAGLDESVFDSALTPERPKRVKQENTASAVSDLGDAPAIASWSVQTFPEMGVVKTESKVDIGDVDMDHLLMGLDDEFDFGDDIEPEVTITVSLS